MQTYNNLRIAPFTALLDSTIGKADHQGGPDFPDWDTEVASRHCRYDTRPIDIRPEAPAAAPKFVAGNFAYLGPISHHFGHQVGEFSQRIMPTLLSGFDGRFVFGAKSILSTDIERSSRFVLEIIDYLGLPRDRIRIINEDAILEHVVIAPQAETIFGKAPSDDYLAALATRRVSREAVPSHRVIYISRAKIVRGVFAAEASLDRMMRAAGAHVVYPEQERLDHLLSLYANADCIVGGEGSAFHAMQLMGKELPDVVVIRRRNDAALFGDKFLGARARSLSFVDAVTGGISGRPDGRYRETGLIALDFDRLTDRLRETTPLDFSSWHRSDYDAGVPETFSRWISGFVAAQPSLSLETAEIVRRESDSLHLPVGEPILRLLDARSGFAHFVAAGEIDKARAAAAEAHLSGTPLSPSALGSLASTAWSAKDKSTAGWAIDMATADDPNSFWLWELKTHIKAGQEDFAAARKAAERAISLDPTRPDIRYMLATIALRQNDTPVAAAQIDAAVAVVAKPHFVALKQRIAALSPQASSDPL
jgi:hypothetical protein